MIPHPLVRQNWLVKIWMFQRSEWPQPLHALLLVPSCSIHPRLILCVLFGVVIDARMGRNHNLPVSTSFLLHTVLHALFKMQVVLWWFCCSCCFCGLRRHWLHLIGRVFMPSIVWPHLTNLNQEHPYSYVKPCLTMYDPKLAYFIHPASHSNSNSIQVLDGVNPEIADAGDTLLLILVLDLEMIFVYLVFSSW